MDYKRKGEVALAILRVIAEEKGLMLRPEEIQRRFPNLSKSTGVPLAELKEFGREIAMELIEKSFSPGRYFGPGSK